MFELSLDKTHDGIWLWLAKYRTCPVLQKNSGSEYEEVLRMNESYLRLVGRYGSCVQSLLKLLFAGK